MSPITKSIRQFANDTSTALDLVENGAVSGLIVTRRGRAVATVLAPTEDLLAECGYSSLDRAGSVSSSTLKSSGVSSFVERVEQEGTPIVITRQNRPAAVLASLEHLEQLLDVESVQEVNRSFEGDVTLDNSTPLPQPAWDHSVMNAAESDGDVTEPVSVAVLPGVDGTWTRAAFVVPAGTYETREAALSSLVSGARRLDFEFDIAEEPDPLEPLTDRRLLA